MRDLMIDCADPHSLASFWGAVLRRPVAGSAEGCGVSLPEGNQPSMIFFRKVADAKQVKNRLHLDLNPVDGTLAAEVQRLTALVPQSWPGMIGGLALAGSCWPIPKATSSARSQVTQELPPSRRALTPSRRNRVIGADKRASSRGDDQREQVYGTRATRQVTRGAGPP